MNLNLFKRMFGNTVEKRSSPPTTWDLLRSGAAIDSASGMPVTAYLAENLSVVFSCVQLISETAAMLPLRCYRKMPGSVRMEDPTQPIAKIFAGDINDKQPANEFIEMMTAHCLLRGNAFAEIVRDGRGQVTKLIPFHPDWVQVVRLPQRDSAEVRYAYEVSVPWYGPINGTRRLLPEEMFHLKDRTDDGVLGKSRLSRAHETFGSALAAERYAASTFRNGAAMSGVLSHPEALGDDAVARLTKSFKQTYTGADNAGAVAVLEEGLKWQQVSVSPHDAQMLDSRKFSVVALASLFRVPPPVIGHYEGGGTHGTIQEIGRWFYSHTMQPWLNRWERAVERSLLSTASRNNFEVEFDCDLLLKGDMLSRFQAYRIAREVGLYNANELRKFEMQNPRTDPGGEEYFAPTNMQPEQTKQPVGDRGGGIAAAGAG